MANPHAIDALLDAINTGDGDAARALAVALAHVTPRCPACGSMQFFIGQFTWNRQDYNAAADVDDRWGLSDYCYESEIPIDATCAECEADCTEVLVRAGVTQFYREPDWSRYERNAEVRS